MNWSSIPIGTILHYDDGLRQETHIILDNVVHMVTLINIDTKSHTQMIGNSQVNSNWVQAQASLPSIPDPDFTLVKYTPLTEQHRKWLNSIPLKFISSGERQVVTNVLRTGRYNEPTRDVLNTIRKIIHKL